MSRNAVATVAFAANAESGTGGQGEFLRAMIHVLEGRRKATVYARAASSPALTCVSLPFEGGWRRAAFDAVVRTPLLNRRTDWLTSLHDEDFDQRVAAAAVPVDLFDSVMGQCAAATMAEPLRSAKRIMTCLNTHILHLDRLLREEGARVGATARAFVSRRMVRRVLDEISRADLVRVCSESARQTFLEHGVAPERVRSVPIGINLDHFQPVDKQDDVFRVVLVSSVTPRKGVHYALEAFERARLQNAELVIIGGTGDAWSRRLIEDYTQRCPNVRLESHDVNHDPIAEHYGRASVVVHAALEDGFGLVIPQALACGRPVIATRESGASEIVRDGETGFLVDARDVETLIDRLRQCHADRRLCEQMASHARASVAHLSYAAHADAMNRLYNEVLATRRTPID